MNENESGIKTKEIRRQNLLKMSSLSSDLKNNVLFLSNRGQMDAIIIAPKVFLTIIKNGKVGDLARAIKERLKIDSMPNITERDAAILASIKNLGEARLVEIADRVGIAPSNIHRRLQFLVKAGLVERQDGTDITYSISDRSLGAAWHRIKLGV